MRLKQTWDVYDLARLLAAVDRSVQEFNSAAHAYQATVLDAMNSGNLKYDKVRSDSLRGGYYPPSLDTTMKKTDATIWAESVGFDMNKTK